MVTDPLLVCTYGGPILINLRYRRQWLHEKQVLMRHHLPKFQAGTVSAIVIPVDDFDDATILITEIGESEGRFRLVTDGEELHLAVEAGAIAVLLGGSFLAIGNKLEYIELYRRLGMSNFALALNPRNLLTDGCGERTQGGLSYYGIKVVQKLEQLSVIIDVSHTSEAGFWDVLEATKGPFIASHSNARAVCDNLRNLTDEQICALADRRGLVALSTYPTLVSANADPTIEDYLDHIDYIARLAGTDYIGIGADFVDHSYDLVMPKIKSTDPTGILYGPLRLVTRDLGKAEDLINVRTGLARRGYSPTDIEKILGGNYLRVWQEVSQKSGT